MSETPASESPASEIQIQAEPSADTRRCTFRVDRTVADLAYVFEHAEEAAGSPLAARILALEPVASVQVLFDQVIVTVAAPHYPNWRPVAGEVGKIIRECLQSGAPVLDPALAEGLPSEDSIRAQVEAVLMEEINPSVASHGGMIELLEVQGNVVYVRMAGGCQGCSSAELTLKQGVETSIRQRVPQVGAVLDQTDHAAGRNPYYSAQG